MNYYLRPEPHSKVLAFWKALLIPFLLFGNNEDGFWGDSRFNPEGKRDFKTAFKWWARNPFHNLFFHAIGFTDKKTEMWGPYVPSITNTSDNGWNAHVVRPVSFSWQRLVLGFLWVITATYLKAFHIADVLPWIAFIPGVLMIFASFRLFPFPFVSYVSPTTLVDSAYAGWRPSGAFGFKLQLNKEVAKQKYPKLYKLFGNS